MAHTDTQQPRVWRNKIFFCDIDGTVLRFPNDKALDEMEKFLATQISDARAQTVRQFIDHTLVHLTNIKKHSKISANSVAMRDKLVVASSIVKNGMHFDDIIWSLELILYMASLRLTTHQALQAADIFWETVAQHSSLFEDVPPFFSWLFEENWGWQPVFVTQSDARLFLDDEGFIYNPQHSSAKKLTRIMPTLHIPTPYIEVEIGDPIGKPDPLFWKGVLENNDFDPDLDLAVMVGDCYRSDLCGIQELGITPILIDRDNKSDLKEVPEARFVIQEFGQLQHILDTLAI